MARRRRTIRLRPKAPARERKRKQRRRRSARAHHRPELIGLALAALGLFLATRAVPGLERRLRRLRDGVRDA